MNTPGQNRPPWSSNAKTFIIIELYAYDVYFSSLISRISKKIPSMCNLSKASGNQNNLPSTQIRFLLPLQTQPKESKLTWKELYSWV